MSKKTPTPRKIALWRYEQLEEALIENLSHLERGSILHRIARSVVRKPSGRTGHISLASLYRWVAAYRKTGLQGLKPRPRPKGQHRCAIADEVIQEALRLLENDTGMTLTLLLAVLRAQFPNAPIPRSTLQRRLAAHPSYARLKRLKTHQQRRTRFVAKGPHDIWQTDAKGPFPVRLVTGALLTAHVLSILDDATRAILAALIVLSPTLGAAVRVFRKAALLWGLSDRLYADRASIFDSQAFRSGLANLGVHRIFTRGRNPPVRGKIEAYHRTLSMWFVDRLKSQGVVDIVHLQQLLDGVIATVYQPHQHRGLQQSPQAALAGRVSPRGVSPTRLVDAFREERMLKAHSKTGEVDISPRTYLVPDELRGQRLSFLVDPADESFPLVVHPQSGVQLSLHPAQITAPEIPATSKTMSGCTGEQRWAQGPLQTLYDSWNGKIRPQAEPGFGLPELYQLLAQACGRHVPQSDAEASLIHRLWNSVGPLGRFPTEKAFASIAAELGKGRAIKTYLEALARRVQPPQEVFSK